MNRINSTEPNPNSQQDYENWRASSCPPPSPCPPEVHLNIQPLPLLHNYWSQSPRPNTPLTTDQNSIYSQPDTQLAPTRYLNSPFPQNQQRVSFSNLMPPPLPRPPQPSQLDPNRISYPPQAQSLSTYSYPLPAQAFSLQQSLPAASFQQNLPPPQPLPTYSYPLPGQVFSLQQSQPAASFQQNLALQPLALPSYSYQPLGQDFSSQQSQPAASFQQNLVRQPPPLPTYSPQPLGQDFSSQQPQPPTSFPQNLAPQLSTSSQSSTDQPKTLSLQTSITEQLPIQQNLTQFLAANNQISNVSSSSDPLTVEKSIQSQSTDDRKFPNTNINSLPTKLKKDKHEKSLLTQHSIKILGMFKANKVLLDDGKKPNSFWYRPYLSRPPIEAIQKLHTWYSGSIGGKKDLFIPLIIDGKKRYISSYYLSLDRDAPAIKSRVIDYKEKKKK